MAADDHYGESTEARARRRRSIITFSLVILMLFFAVWYALSYIRADETRETSPTTSSSTTSCDLTPEEVEVNVYNATDRPGLAAQVAKGLRGRGFEVKTVANDPKRAELTGLGELRHGTAGKAGADLVDEHVGSFARKVDERTRTNVDVVLGPTFDGLVDKESVPDC
ncbi:LytR C-terminal domain-containing protein [Janibacter sp. DB-40]|uniref:LytR C-terminal domain-containing protein n=1 Tax=Janibacter sp. DB-40 TaxID=3028808 RepID=UPI002405BEA4|nr:LytR C-terminal domain-containing protein [Janibacter sp. DB-40]